jgi:hypothetical protein
MPSSELDASTHFQADVDPTAPVPALVLPAITVTHTRTSTYSAVRRKIAGTSQLFFKKPFMTKQKQPVTKKVTVPISKRALLARLNRKLDADHAAVKITRDGTPARRALGEYYVVGFHDGGVSDADIDLEAYGRAHGALAQHEHLADE